MKYYDSGKVLRFLDRIESQKESEVAHPAHVLFHTCDECNLSCVHCPYTHSRSKLSREAFLSLCFAISTNKNIRACSFSGGGEPTLQPGLAEGIKILRGKQLGLITNGTMLESLGDAAAYLSWVNVSLDSVTPYEFELYKGVQLFNRVVDNIFILKNTYPHVNVRVSFIGRCDQNYDSVLIHAFLARGISVRVKGIPGRYMVPKGVDVSPTYKQEKSPISVVCHTKYMFPVIGSDGCISCSCTFAQDTSGAYRMSNSIKDSLVMLASGIPTAGHSCCNPVRKDNCYHDRLNYDVSSVLTTESDWMFL